MYGLPARLENFHNKQLFKHRLTSRAEKEAQNYQARIQGSGGKELHDFFDGL